MLKKTIKYVDYDGNEREEDFYFYMNQAELVKMNVSKAGGLENYLRKLITDLNGKEIMNTIEEIILMSYGEKSPDGKRFVKGKELSEAFKQTEAYSILFMELISDENAAWAFIKGMLPSDLAKKVEEAEKDGSIKPPVKS